MLWKINSSVLETQRGDVEEHQPARIRKRNRGGLYVREILSGSMIVSVNQL
jgi:hypothetical protein